MDLNSSISNKASSISNRSQQLWTPLIKSNKLCQLPKLNVNPPKTQDEERPYISMQQNNNRIDIDNSKKATRYIANQLSRKHESCINIPPKPALQVSTRANHSVDFINSFCGETTLNAKPRSPQPFNHFDVYLGKPEHQIS